MSKITPFLWFDDQAEEAATFYTSIFNHARLGDFVRYGEAAAAASGRPEGSVMAGEFEIEGQTISVLSGGPIFHFTPAISFVVSCETQQEIDELWGKLSAGGEVLMPLQQYPFSDKFGWTNDKYGLSWQLNLAGGGQKITPSLLFVGDQHGKAEAAINFYTSLFEDSGITHITRYGPGGPEPEGTVMHAVFSLAGQQFTAMDSGQEHAFSFNEAISFVVNCETQAEVDHFWDKLTEGGDETAQQCGWLKDKYGVSWQIVPGIVPRLMSDPDPEKSQRAMQAILQMKKIDIEILQQVVAGQ